MVYYNKDTNCKLRDLKFEDLLLIKDWRNEQIDILRQNKKLTDDDQKKYWDKISNSDTEKLFAIEDKSGKLIGYGGFVNLDMKYRKAEISFLLKTEIKEDSDQHVVVFSETLKFLIAYGFRELFLNRIYTETYEFRKKHMDVLENLKFKKEGILRENIIKNGNFFNSIIHSIIIKDLNYEK